MTKKEIENYLKRVDELGAKLTGKDKETFAWLIYGYNQCVKLLNETEEQCKRQKEVIDKTIEYINNHINQETFDGYMDSYELKKLLDILKEEE